MTGDVEAMIAAACQLATAQVQRAGTDRTAQIRGGRCERPAPLSGRRYVVTWPAGRIAWVHRNVPSSRKDDQTTAARSDTRARTRDSRHGAGQLAAPGTAHRLRRCADA